MSKREWVPKADLRFRVDCIAVHHQPLVTIPRVVATLAVIYAVYLVWQYCIGGR